MKCSCGFECETEEEALEHCMDAHADKCDEKLQEYVPESVQDACDELFS